MPVKAKKTVKKAKESVKKAVKKVNTVHLCLTISPKQHKKISTYCKKHKITKAALIRQYIDNLS